MLDLGLAILHHLLAFGLVAILMAESVLVRPGITPDQCRRVAGIDAGYGVSSGLLLIVGGARLAFAAKGWDWYQANPWFWAKIGTFVAVGLLSIPPTIRYIAWSRRLKAEPDWTPDTAEIRGVRRWIALEVVGIMLIIAFAATMARFQGLPQ